MRERIISKSANKPRKKLDESERQKIGKGREKLEESGGEGKRKCFI